MAGNTSPAPAEVPPSAFTFGYDTLGRLIEASQPGGNTAVYKWDSVGDLTSVLQQSSASVSVLQLAPSSGGVGATVRIYGTGFSATPSEDSVTFNGTQASVSAATATELVATVPSGATSGTVSVTAPGGSASSASPFTVLTAGAPTITSVSPKVIAAGEALNVTGSNFDANSANDIVAVGSIIQLVSSGSSSSFLVSELQAGGSGHVRVATPNGEAVGPDVFVTPPGYTASHIESAVRVNTGESHTVTTNTGGNGALLIFDGRAGERIGIDMTNIALKGTQGAYTSLYDPYGQTALQREWISSTTNTREITLQATGTYTLAEEPETATTGSVTFTVYEESPPITASVVPSATGEPVSIATTPFQNAKITFQGTQGERIFVHTANSTYGSNLEGVVEGPEGTTVIKQSLGSTPDIDTFTLPTSGSYTLVINPLKDVTGSVNVTVYEVPPDLSATVTPAPAGVEQAIATNVGQNAKISFQGTQSERISIGSSGNTYGNNLYISVLKPDGSELLVRKLLTTSGSFIDTFTLPSAGTYTILLDPYKDQAGKVNLTVYEVPPDFSASLTPSSAGASQTVTTSTPGQNAKVTFQGSAGERLFVDTSGTTYGNNLYASILKPDGTNLFSARLLNTLSYYIDTVTLPVTGTYTIYLDPQKEQTGTVNLTVYEVIDFTASVTPSPTGTAQAVTTATPGQNASVTFQGNAGEKIFVDSSGNTYGYNLNASILKPDGTSLVAAKGLNTGAYYIDTVTLPVSGTYTLFLDPQKDQTGTINLAIYEAVDFSASVTPSVTGAVQTVTTSTPGQNATVSFQGTAGEKIFVDSSGSTYGFNLNASILKPDGTSFAAAKGLNSSAYYIDTVTLPVSGTYTILLDPQKDQTGTIKLVVYEVPADFAASVNPSTAGAAQTVTTSTPGQNGQVTFQGTAGERVFVDSTGTTYGSNLNAAIVKPDGTSLVAAKALNSSTYYIDTVTLPVSGTYSISLDPQKDQTGTIKLTVYEVPADFSATTTPTEAGGIVKVSTTVPGQNGAITFQGTEGQRVSIDTSAWSYGGTGCCNVEVGLVQPSGSYLVALKYVYSSSPFIDTVTLPSTGTYTIVVEPLKDITGSITVTTYVVPPDYSGSIAIGGAAVTFATATPGQNALLSFTGPEKKTIKLTASAVTYGTSTCCSTKISVRKPDGTNLVAPTNIGTSGGTISSTLTVAGTYTVYVDPQSDATGKMTLTLVDPPFDPLMAHDEGELPFSEANVTIGPVAATTASPSAASSRGSHAAVAKSAAPAPRRAHAARRIRQGASRRQPQAGKHKSGTAPVHAPAVETPLQIAQRFRPNLGDWIPTARNRKGDWTTHFPLSPVPSLPMLSAPEQVTALAGQALKLNGEALANVTLSLQGTGLATRTDRTGRFLLQGAPTGHHVLVIEGGTAGTPGERYGHFEVGVDLTSGITTELGYTIWMPKLDRAHAVTIGSPTDAEVTVTTPHIPGLEVKIPKGSAITSSSGRPVRQLSITSVPVDRPPFPLPLGIKVPLYFTVQPGGAYLSKGARIIYPNYTHLPPGQRVSFWNYDAVDRGWYIYGHGTVTRDAKQVVPDPGVEVWEFTGAMISAGGEPPAEAPSLNEESPAGSGGEGPSGSPNEETASGGDPVDLKSGLVVVRKTDLALPDTLPISLTRTYRPGDLAFRSFGIGTTNLYDLNLWSVTNYTAADIILPDGARVHYVRTSPGTGFENAVYTASTTSVAFHGSTIVWDHEEHGWNLTLRSGLVYHFGENAPLAWIRDRYGNRITLIRDKEEHLTEIISPHGRWIKLAYDDRGCIAKATDDTGRTVVYGYDAYKDLVAVTDANGGVTKYTYDTYGETYELLGITDAKGVTYLENSYDKAGRVVWQRLADGATYKFEYTTDPETGKVVEATTTNPNGSITQASFNSDGYATSITEAAHTALAQTTTYERRPGDDLVTAVTDPLGRKTAYGYDSNDDITSVVELVGTSKARSTTMTYGSYGLLTSVTDPLNDTTSYGYDSSGDLTSITDPLERTTTIAYANKDGEPTSITDPAHEVTTAGYSLGELTSVEDPLGNKLKQYTDAAGRVLQDTDALGNTMHYTWDPLNQLTAVIDPTGSETKLAYDPNGNLTGVTDPQGHKTTYAYTVRDQVESRTDPLGQVERYGYDPEGNLTAFTDRDGHRTTFMYDLLNRRTFKGSGTTGTGESQSYESTVNYTYDAGDRLTQAADSAGGTFNRGWDEFNEVTSESGPQGSVNYTYDAAGRRTSMATAGQPEVTYSYDAAGQLLGVNSLESTAFSYDAAGRRTSALLPGGVQAEYTYDPDSNLTGIGYRHGATAMGDLNYAYDPNGDRTAIWGSYARVNLPEPFASATYDANQRFTARGAQTFSYDPDGKLTNDGTTSYGWNARSQLTSLNGPVNASFSYDPFGRREQKTVNGVATSYLYDGVNPLLEISGGGVQARYLNGLGVDERFARTDTSGTKAMLTDALGSTIALADGEGNVKTSYTYEPFGKASSSGEASANPFQYTGRENDGTGLQYSRARYYDPANGRFISEDPLRAGAPGSNYYDYATSNPLLYDDPFGLCASWSCKYHEFKRAVFNNFRRLGIDAARGINSVVTDFVDTTTPLGCTADSDSGRKDANGPNGNGGGGESMLACSAHILLNDAAGCFEGGDLGGLMGIVAGAAVGNPLLGAAAGGIGGCIGGAYFKNKLPVDPFDPASGGP